MHFALETAINPLAIYLMWRWDVIAVTAAQTKPCSSDFKDKRTEYKSNVVDPLEDQSALDQHKSMIFVNRGIACLG